MPAMPGKVSVAPIAAMIDSVKATFRNSAMLATIPNRP